jgi:hypothetical protein
MRCAAVLALALLAGCAHPANISTSLEVATRGPDLTVITLKVKNQEDRATTPLVIDVTVRVRLGGEWGKPISVIHPAGFVLNKHEEQILRSTVRLKGEAVRTRIQIKEQETGAVVVSEEAERQLGKTS